MRHPGRTFLAVMLLVSGCAARPQPRPETPSNPDVLVPGAAAPSPAPARMVIPAPVLQAPSSVFAEFLEAFHAGRDEVAWALLSERVRQGAAPAAVLDSLRGRFTGWHSYRLVVDDQVGPDVAVVSVSAGQDRAAAAALVRENGKWRIAASPARPVPPPVIGARTAVQVPGAVQSLWLDSHPVAATRAGEADLPVPLPPGMHVLTVLAGEPGRPPEAYAWAFRAP